MWQKRKSPEYTSTLLPLKPEQRIAIAALCERLAADPRDTIHNPIIVDRDTREIEIAGVWLRYRLRPQLRVIVFLSVEQV
jgi:hypothetical protein